MAIPQSLLATLAALGTAGATANARASLDERRRDDWIVAGLVQRVERRAAAADAARLAAPTGIRRSA